MAGWVCFQQNSVFASGIVWNLHFVQGLCYIIYIFTPFEETKHWTTSLRLRKEHFFYMIPGVNWWSLLSYHFSLKRESAGSWCFQTRPAFLWATTTFQKMAKEKNLLGRLLLEMKRDISHPCWKGGKSQDEFCQMRDHRDAQLAIPKLIVPSVQVNIRAGRFPEPDANGHVALSLPINKLSNTGSLNP